MWRVVVGWCDFVLEGEVVGDCEVAVEVDACSVIRWDCECRNWLARTLASDARDARALLGRAETSADSAFSELMYSIEFLHLSSDGHPIVKSSGR